MKNEEEMQEVMYVSQEAFDELMELYLHEKKLRKSLQEENERLKKKIDEDRWEEILIEEQK